MELRNFFLENWYYWGKLTFFKIHIFCVKIWEK